MKWLAMGELLTLFIIMIVSGFLLCAALSQHQRHNARKEWEPWHARLAAAEGKARHDGKKRSTNLPAVVIALIVVLGLIVIDHFKGPFLPDEFYCLSDGGPQITGKCTAHRNLIAKSP